MALAYSELAKRVSPEYELNISQIATLRKDWKVFLHIKTPLHICLRSD